MQQKMTLHIGELISQKIEDEGRTKKWLAQQIGCGQSCLYKMLKNRSMCVNVLMKISIAMKYDFFEHLSMYYIGGQLNA